MKVQDIQWFEVEDGILWVSISDKQQQIQVKPFLDKLIEALEIDDYEEETLEVHVSGVSDSFDPRECDGHKQEEWSDSLSLESFLTKEIIARTI